MKTLSADGEINMADKELFLVDTEAWYRVQHPDWSEMQVQEALREVRFMSLLEFYEEAVKLHPELEEQFPLLPARPYSGYSNEVAREDAL